MPLGEIARRLFVARSFEKIFACRAEQIGAIFGLARDSSLSGGRRAR
jgi:hypothetical protein